MDNQFNFNYDNVISKDVDNYLYNEENIEKLTRNYIISDANILDKKNLIRMKKEYYKVLNIRDYNIIQDRLYEGKSKSEILSFELTRILRKTDDPEILDSISSIQSVLSSYKGDITDDLYLDIADIILSFEMLLGMKIGLFRELCVIFEHKLHDIDLMINKEKCRKK